VIAETAPAFAAPFVDWKNAGARIYVFTWDMRMRRQCQALFAGAHVFVPCVITW
jgi:hypothetical protein